MNTAPSLRSVFTRWFAGTLLVLYGVAATAVWLHARASDQQYAILSLKAEVEALAGYLAATGRLDAPEFTAPEATPFPIWFRLRQGGQILAQTPGAPEPRLSRAGAARDEGLTGGARAVGGPYLSVFHTVGGQLQGTTLEAITPTASFTSGQYTLAAALALAGLVVIPLAALGGRRLARRALRPIDGLVSGIRSLDSSRLSDRLVLPPGAVQEVAVLASAFNDLLATLQASVNTMRRFTADASHEIRNPLSVLRTGLEIALRRPREAAEYRALIQENIREIDRLQAVLEGLLALTREVPGTPIPLSKNPVDLAHLVAQTADTFATVADERGIHIEREIEAGVTVEGDAQLLRLAAFNLIDNALKHSPKGDAVRVTLTLPDGEAQLVVADQGPGIPPENRDRLFRRYSRAERTGEPGFGGLGLSVIVWVTERHGGRVEILDTERGAAFKISLPGRRAHHDPAAAPASSTPARG